MGKMNKQKSTKEGNICSLTNGGDNTSIDIATYGLNQSRGAADLLNFSTITTSGCVKFSWVAYIIAPNIQCFVVNSFFGCIFKLLYVKVQGSEDKKLFFELAVYLDEKE